MACQGSPVWLIPLGLADLQGLLAAVETQQIINFVLRILETSHLILRKTSTPTKLNRHSFVFDLTGFRVTVRLSSCLGSSLIVILTRIFYQNNFSGFFNKFS